MKPLLIIETGGPGGAERVVSTLAKWLKQQNIDLGVVTFREGWLTEELDSHDIKRYLIESTRKLDLSLPLRLAKLIRKESYTIVHSHLLDSNFYGSIAARLANVPHLATEHGDVHHIGQKSFLQTKIKTISLLGSHCAAVSGYSADKLKELGFSTKRLLSIPNPIFLADQNENIRKEKRTELGITQDWREHWLWIHVANLRPVKDQETLLRAFAESLKNSKQPQSLALIGDGEEKSKLLTIAKKLQITEQVYFLGFRQDVRSWLHAADGFLLSSLSESLPMALIEAATNGLFIISTRVGGVAEIVASPEYGTLVPKANPEALGSAIKQALQNPEQTKAGGQALKDYAQKRFSVDSVMEKYLEMYSRLEWEALKR